MAKLCLKKPSKRMPAKRRYKIEKKVRQHNKKKRREERKNPKKSKKNKLIVVPNECPFKEEVLKEAQKFKEQEKEAFKKRFEKPMEDAEMRSETEQLNELLAHVEKTNAEHDLVNDQDTEEEPEYKGDGTSTTKENSLKAYFKEFKKVVDAADVILEVVDARDPLGTRCQQVEDAVKQAPGNKRLVLVLNKADLVPKENLDKWLKYLRRSLPAVAFKASTQKQKTKLSHKQMKLWKQRDVNVSPCIGAEILMSLLANYCRNKDIKTAIHVGVVGKFQPVSVTLEGTGKISDENLQKGNFAYLQFCQIVDDNFCLLLPGLPNVGKSSIINSLKRARACSVGSVPGVTKTAQLVELDKKIKLLDSPGVVFSSGPKESNTLSDSVTALKNAVNPQSIKDPLTAATAILQRIDKAQILELYNVPDFDTPQEFFANLARSTGRIKKGGIPDSHAAAQVVISNWNSGKIRYCTIPPEVEENSHVSATIVNEYAAEFDLNSVQEAEEKLLSSFEKSSDSKVAKVPVTELPPGSPVQAADDKMDEDTVEDGLLGGNVTVIPKKKARRGGGGKAADTESKSEKALMSLQGNQQLNKIQKQSLKKMKKQRERQLKLQARQSNSVVGNFPLNNSDKDAYDFGTDFSMS